MTTNSHSPSPASQSPSSWRRGRGFLLTLSLLPVAGAGIAVAALLSSSADKSDSRKTGSASLDTSSLASKHPVRPFETSDSDPFARVPSSPPSGNPVTREKGEHGHPLYSANDDKRQVPSVNRRGDYHRQVGGFDELLKKSNQWAGERRRSISSMPAEERLALVEEFADRRLDQIGEQYLLTADQEAALFNALARKSAFFDPSFEIVGAVPKGGGDDSAAAPSGSNSAETDAAKLDSGEIADLDDILFDLLDGEQKGDFVEDAVDRDLWWTSIIAELEQDLLDEADAVRAAPARESEPSTSPSADSNPGAASSVPAPQAEPVPVPSGRGGLNIFELGDE